MPPFATKEPQQYQAQRVVTTAEWFSGSTDTPPAETHVSTSFMARDGEKRREEYESPSGERVVYIENSSERFVVLPSKKLFSDLSVTSKDTNPIPSRNEIEPSIDLVLNESRTESIYQKLGTEGLNDRMTTKYRVTTDQSPVYASAQNETTIWIDAVL